MTQKKKDIGPVKYVYLMIKMFILRCPKCKHKMKYQPTSIPLEGKSKKCVYCGFNINVRKNIIKANKPQKWL